MFLGDGRLCAGGGATEIELARQLYSIGEGCPGMEQYAMKKFAESLEVVPRTLAENSGQLATEAISALYAAHQAGNTEHGVDIGDGSAKDMLASEVLDVLATKRSAVKLAADAAITVLRVDTVRFQCLLSLPAPLRKCFANAMRSPLADNYGEAGRRTEGVTLSSIQCILLLHRLLLLG